MFPFWILLLLASILQINAYLYDTYSGEHFDAITINSAGRFSRGVIVALYSKQDCPKDLEKIEKLRPYLPDSNYLLFVNFDHVTSGFHTWYQLNAKDNLKHRYKIKSCFKALFFPPGSSPKNTPHIWNPNKDKDFIKWAWDMIKVPVKVKNSLKEAVTVKFFGKGPSLEEISLEAEEEKDIKAFISYKIFIMNKSNDKLMRAGVVTDPMLSFTTTKDHKQMKELKSMSEFIKKVDKDDEKLKKKFDNFLKEHAKRALLNLKQPMMLPNFTETGFTKMKMPENLYKTLKDFYNDHKQYSKPESTVNIGYINIEERPCNLVHLQLQSQIYEDIPSMIQPELEKWCNCDLEFTHLYGIREYYSGHILHHHVDLISSHVISAIFQIDRDLGDAEDWPLEVIKYNGEREKVILEAGEMLLYESGKLIHGRPTYFKGKSYANAFIHFKPKTPWRFEINETHIINPSKKKAEPIFETLTDVTITKPLYVSPSRKIRKDEL